MESSIFSISNDYYFYISLLFFLKERIVFDVILREKKIEKRRIEKRKLNTTYFYLPFLQNKNPIKTEKLS